MKYLYFCIPWVFLLFPEIVLGQCQQPFGISFTQKTTTSVDFRWSDPNVLPIGWDIEIVKKGNMPSGIPLNTNPIPVKTFQVAGLQPSTFYEIYLRSICSDQIKSPWNGPFLVSTVLENPTNCQIDLDLRDNGSESFAIEIKDIGNLGQDIFLSAVELITEHEWPADVRITLVNPAGKSAILTNYHGTGGLHFGNIMDSFCFQSTRFSDQACEEFTSAKPPFIGVYTPFELLSNLHDFTPSNGIWRIIFHDRAAFHRGNLKFLKLHLTRENCQLPADFFITQITSHSIQAVWTPNMSCQSVKITIKEKGKPDDEEIVYFLNCLDGQFTIQNLLPETDYEIFIQSLCGAELSQQSCTQEFRTDCKPATISESFNNQNKCVESCLFNCHIQGVWSNASNNTQSWIVWDQKTDTENTGPDEGISGEGKFIYIESQPDLCGVNEVVLQSSCIRINSNLDGCDLSFYYHMFGDGIGSLRFQISQDQGNSWTTLWSKEGSQGNQWNRVLLSLEPFHQSDAIFRFVARNLDDIQGDIALDQIDFFGSVLLTDLNTYYRDEDGDSYGNSLEFIKICQTTPPVGYVVDSGDCNDQNQSIFPGQTEILCNLVDENCNGMSDDELPGFDLAYQSAIQHESCRGQKNGKIELFISGGTPPYTILWNNGSAAKDLTEVGFGIYYCTISDASGCSLRSDFFTIQALQSIEYVVTGIFKPSCLGKSDGSIFVNHSGGQPPYTYTWSNGSNIKNLENAPEGMYTLTITDRNGCSMITAPIFLQALPAISAGALSIKHPSCSYSTNGEIILGVVNGQAPYFFNWQDGSTNSFLRNIPAGTYHCTVTDNIGCQSILHITLIAPPLLEVKVVSVEPTRCYGEKNGVIKTNTSGGSPPYLYFWGHSAFSDDVFDLGAGFYALTVTDKNGCSNQINGIEVKQPPPLTSKTDSVIAAKCPLGQNGKIFLSSQGGSPPYHYSWNTSIFGDNPILENIPHGVYGVIVFDSRGCKYNLGHVLVPYYNDSIKIEGDITQENECYQDRNGEISASILNGSPPFDYNWSNGLQYIIQESKDTISGLASGTYTLTVTDREGCVGTSTTFIIDDVPELSYVVDDFKNNACDYDSLGFIDISIMNSQGNYVVQWSHGPLGSSVVGLSNGHYLATITDEAGCTLVTQPFMISSISQLQVEAIIQHAQPNVGNGNICLVIEGSAGTYFILWDPKMKEISGRCASSLEPGSYIIKITDSLGCEITLDLMVEEKVATYENFFPTTLSFPNPTTGIFYVNSKYPLEQGILFDVSGRKIEEIPSADQNNMIDISHVPSGLYFLELRFKNHRIMEKIVKI